ncbi:hypothetical protein ACFVT5_40595 [Streptomyces sp. NPDC058001]|uniref:hypothetical protein n=1 Tax=Streptomyces sp. NPDC058001 TaxID=3346300 RepID=UPI0036EE7FE3
MTRHSTETRTTVIDTAGLLVAAEIERHRPEGVESATVRRNDDASYTVHTTALDDSRLAADVPGPLLPGGDLGVPALLAAVRSSRTEELPPVLTLTTSLANGLAPVPGTLDRDGGQLVQRTTDAQVRVSQDGELDEYAQSAPMQQLVHRRVP